MRGTRNWLDNAQANRRFIPACAGNTETLYHGVSSASVHPRMCGEHAITLNPPFADGGSSPHVRGTQHSQRRTEIRSRFIPACAGNTHAHTRTRSCDPVHPRMCGEHTGKRALAAVAAGSSPHVRGTLFRKTTRWVPLRFIPACAGNTFARRKSVGWTAVHPRMCGEH